MFPIPVGINWFKVGAAAFVLVAFLGMGLYIKYQGAKIETLTVKLETSEINNKQLNNTILAQNASIVESNKKYEEVQTQLTEANTLNKALVKEFKVIKDEIKKKPVPATCEASLQEMIETGKKIGKSWKR